MSRVLLCRVGEPPRTTSILPDDAGDYSTALQETLGGPVACLALDDGIQLCCNRNGLVFGLALTRRILAMALTEPGQFKITLEAEDSASGLGVEGWPANGDFLVARIAVDGGLADLTESDIKRWMFWLGLDYILKRC